MNRKKLQRILLVEDDPHLRMVARVTLERVGGFEVRTCSTGKEAVQAAGEFRPDLVLLDVMMPDMDGVATLQELRRTADVPEMEFVFMTAKALKSEIDALQGWGVLGIVSKPFDPMKLPSQLLELWDGPAP